MQVKIVKGTSKKGNQYEAIRVSIGEYESLLFPTRAELAYIKGLIRDKSHQEFSDELEDFDNA